MKTDPALRSSLPPIASATSPTPTAPAAAPPPKPSSDFAAAVAKPPAPTVLSPAQEQLQTAHSVEMLPGLASSAAVDAFALVPGQDPNAVSLPDMIKTLGSTPEGRATLQKLVDHLQTENGIQFPPGAVDLMIKDPTLVTNMMVMTPGQLRAGFQRMDARQKTPPVPSEPSHLLPKTFDLAQAASAHIPMPHFHRDSLGSGLYRGYVPKNPVSNEELRNNTITGEVLNRLARNQVKGPAEQFTVKYQGHSFNTLNGLLGALQKDDCQVKVTVEQAVGDFGWLSMQKPGSTEFYDVAAPVMVKTGIVKDGKEAIIPATHGQLHIQIEKGPHTQGPGLTGEVNFFQGVAGVSFSPVGERSNPPWKGSVVNDHFSGDEGFKAVKLAGLYKGVVDKVVIAKHLPRDGYGDTGVCNDSVATIQYALHQKNTLYPLVRNSALLTGELATEAKNAHGEDATLLGVLQKSIADLPSDASGLAPDARQRAAASLPWTIGDDAFRTVVDARPVLAPDGAAP